jgi:hypothetical protein
VLAHLCGERVLAGILELLVAAHGEPALQLRLLRALRALSAEADALAPLQRAGAIPALAPFLAPPEGAPLPTDPDPHPWLHSKRVFLPRHHPAILLSPPSP